MARKLRSLWARTVSRASFRFSLKSLCIAGPKFPLAALRSDQVLRRAWRDKFKKKTDDGGEQERNQDRKNRGSNGNRTEQPHHLGNRDRKQNAQQSAGGGKQR